MRTGLELHLHSPATDAPDLSAFGRFVGEWDLEWHGSTDDGRPVSGPGRCAFGWVLAGSAIQDVWNVPPVAPGDTGIAGRGFHGSTLRFRDATIDAWQTVWIEPINRRIRSFIGKEQPDGIVLISTDGTPHLRWSFRDIETASFTWVGESSNDNGHTWVENERIMAVRR